MFRVRDCINRGKRRIGKVKIGIRGRKKGTTKRWGEARVEGGTHAGRRYWGSLSGSGNMGGKNGGAEPSRHWEGRGQVGFAKPVMYKKKSKGNLNKQRKLFKTEGVGRGTNKKKTPLLGLCTYGRWVNVKNKPLRLQDLVNNAARVRKAEMGT